MDQLEEEDLNLLKKEIQRMTGEEKNSNFMILFILISFFRDLNFHNCPPPPPPPAAAAAAASKCIVFILIINLSAFLFVVWHRPAGISTLPTPTRPANSDDLNLQSLCCSKCWKQIKFYRSKTIQRLHIS
jgi:hypothetical protein